MNIYVVAQVHDVYMFPASKKVFKTEKGVLEEYKRLSEKGYKDIKILKAQWIEDDLSQHVQLKKSVEREEKC